MKAQEVLRRETLRLALSAVHNEEVAKRSALDDAAVEAVLRRQVKMRRESIEAFDKGNRPELAAKERDELAILEGYLPQQLGAEAIRHYDRATEVEPLAENLYRRLMLAHVEQGSPAEAMRVYRRCRERLSLQVSMAPSRETQALVERINANP